MSTRFPTAMGDSADTLIPIHPQPSIFGTTEAFVDESVRGEIAGDEFVPEKRLVTPFMIEEIIGQPAWNAQDAVRQADAAVARAKRNGWRQELQPDASSKKVHYYVDGESLCPRGYSAPTRSRVPSPSSMDTWDRLACRICARLKRETRPDL